MIIANRKRRCYVRWNTTIHRLIAESHTKKIFFAKRMLVIMFQKLESPRVMFVTVAISVIKKLPMLIMFNFRHIERDSVKDYSMRLLFTRYIFIAAVSTYVVSKMHAHTKVEICIPLVAVDCFQKYWCTIVQSIFQFLLGFGIIGPIVVSLKMEFCPCIR